MRILGIVIAAFIFLICIMVGYEYVLTWQSLVVGCVVIPVCLKIHKIIKEECNG